MTSQRILKHEERPHQVYVLRDSNDAVLYIGVSSRVQARIATHRRSQPWRDEIDPTRTVVMEPMEWEDALALEELGIQQHAPKHNKRKRNGSKEVALGLRHIVAAERRLSRAAATGDPGAIAEYERWRDAQLAEAARAMRERPPTSLAAIFGGMAS